MRSSQKDIAFGTLGPTIIRRQDNAFMPARQEVAAMHIPAVKHSFGTA
jgi:hypothetical protein